MSGSDEDKKNNDNAAASQRAGLIVEPDDSDEKGSFAAQIAQAVAETERLMRQSDEEASAVGRGKSWELARQLVIDFRPVPWFIWRLCNYVLGQTGQINDISEGLVFGLRRLVFATAADPVLGTGTKINDVRRALKAVPADVIAAVSVIHAICRRMASRPLDRIWRPILDDALLRASIGHRVGLQDPAFGPGRGMLAGFAGRAGLVMLIASGEVDQARTALEMLATGARISTVGMEVYQTEPLQVSALTLSAAGCGRDAAFGTAAYALKEMGIVGCESLDQQKWLAAFAICEGVRLQQEDRIDDESWTVLGFLDEAERSALFVEAKKLIRQGHTWNWLV